MIMMNTSLYVLVFWKRAVDKLIYTKDIPLLKGIDFSLLFFQYTTNRKICKITFVHLNEALFLGKLFSMKNLIKLYFNLTRNEGVDGKETNRDF
jgi:hypothetical protein